MWSRLSSQSEATIQPPPTQNETAQECYIYIHVLDLSNVSYNTTHISAEMGSAARFCVAGPCRLRANVSKDKLSVLCPKA